MSLFTKIKQDWQARHRRRLAAKLQRMIAAAADENNGVLSLHCDIILRGDVYACGDTVLQGDMDARGDMILQEGICVRGDILAGGDVITDGRIASMGDAYVHGRIDSHNDVTACAHTPDWVTVPKKKIEANP